MKKLFIPSVLLLFCLFVLPYPALAAGISVSNSGAKYAGDDVTISITATGTDFNAFSGTISASGPIKITSATPGDALWVQKPSGAGDFAGALTNTTNSFRITALKVHSTGTGTGKISVTNVKLANKGTIVGNDNSSTSFTFERRPTPPGAITISSATHPDQATFYETTTATLNWDKPSGITGFADLLDENAATTPPSTVTDANTTASYPNLAIGTHYFHIKALNGDGWGPVSHFTINIKEPDPKIKDDINKPYISNIQKSASYLNNPTDGTFEGVTITGTTLPNYTANILLNPAPKIPEGKSLSVLADANGIFSLNIDFPIPAGFYMLTIQGQDNKTLTPLSDPENFEISLAKGGKINILTKDDEKEPVIPPKKWYEKLNWLRVSIAATSLALILAIILVIVLLRHHQKKIK